MTEPGVKCLVWDLDDTLWAGRVGEDAAPELRPGVADALAALDGCGVLQSVASVNDHALAWAHLTRLGVADYFLAPEIHFGDKAESVARIADRLKTQPHEMAFIDDDPFQRARVSAAHPGLLVLDVTECRALPADLRFRPGVLTEEGRNRRHLVRTDLAREEDCARHESLEAFLAGCELRFTGRRATPADTNRVGELAARTNRMNMADSRPGRDEIASRIADPAAPVLIGQLRDRFGDYGTVAAAFIEVDATVARVDGLWISCRVGQRGVPAAFFTFLGRYAQACGAGTLAVEYRPTTTNRMAAFHLGQYGFRLGDGTDGRAYRLDLTDGIRPFPKWMTADDTK